MALEPLEPLPGGDGVGNVRARPRPEGPGGHLTRLEVQVDRLRLVLGPPAVEVHGLLAVVVDHPPDLVDVGVVRVALEALGQVAVQAWFVTHASAAELPRPRVGAAGNASQYEQLTSSVAFVGTDRTV